MTDTATTTVTTSQLILTCPACRQPVSGRVTLRLEVEQLPLGDSPAAGQVDLQGTVVGLSVRHDCTPAVARSPLEQALAMRGHRPLPPTGDSLG